MLLLLWSAKPAAAINVYSRIIKYVQNPQTKNYEVKVVDTMQVYFHVWKRTTTTSDDGTTSSSDEELQWGFDNSEKGKTKQKPSTASIEGASGTETWAYYTCPDDMSSSADSVSYYIIVAVYNSDGTKCLWQTEDISDLKNLKEDVYLEVEYMPYKTSAGVDYSRYAIHEKNVHQVQGEDLIYYLCDKDGKHIAQFDNIRNQEAANITGESTTRIIGHSINTSLWTLGVKKDKLPTNFYIDGGAYTSSTTTAGADTTVWTSYYQYRPYSDFDLGSEDNWTNYGSATYDNCLQTNNYTFSLTDNNTNTASYTLSLNTSTLTNWYHNVNPGGDYTKNQNISVWHTSGQKEYGFRSVMIERNEELTEDADGYYLLVNMVQLRPEDGYENQEGSTGSWDMTSQTRKMEKLTFSDSDSTSTFKKTLTANLMYDDGDVVYHYRVPKPNDTWESLFMAFCPQSVGDNWSTLLSTYEDSTETDTEAKEALNPWNMIIRPHIQEGKTSMSLKGGVFIPTHNTMEALTPNLANSDYSKFDVFLNLTKSMYLIAPVVSYDLTGPAVSYYNPSSHSWEDGSSDMWGNGQIQYHYMAMAYNTKENCWQYTGKFNHSINRNEDGSVADTEGGFRIRTNQLYTINYHEEPYWFYSQNSGEVKENIECHTQKYSEYVSEAEASDTTTAITTSRPHIVETEWTSSGLDTTAVVNEWVYEDGTHNPNGPDSYYYNHVVECETGYPLWADAKNYTPEGGYGEEQQRLHLNFDLESGYYTIKFYPQGDETGKPYYTLEKATDPGTEIPTDDKTYKYLRTYSSNLAYEKPDGMDAFIVVGVDQTTNYVLLRKLTLSYLPANTGLIIAYKTDLSTAADTTYLEYSSDLSKEQFVDIAENMPKLSLSLYSGTSTTDYCYGKGTNYLMPTTQSDGSTISSIPTTEFEDGYENEKVAYRNYNFYLIRHYKKNDDGTYDKTTIDSCDLAFRRIKIYTSTEYPSLSDSTITALNTPTAGRAYLRLPGNISGGVTYGTYTNKWGEQLDETSQAKSAYYQYFLDFDEDSTTAISEVKTDERKADDAIYTLQGIRVYKPLKRGIYIQNNKKFIVK